MIKIDSFHFANYTLVVDGNDGENQLVIVGSCGQDGNTPLMSLEASVDGGIGLFADFGRDLDPLGAQIEGEMPKTYDSHETVRRIVTRWCERGTPPTDIERRMIDDEVVRIVAAWKAHYHTY